MATALARAVEIENLGFFYVRRLYFAQAGDRMDGHSHDFDHDHLLRRGALTVRCVQRDRTTHLAQYAAPAIIPIPAEVHHEFTATEDDTEGWCVFPVRDLSGQPVHALESQSSQIDGRVVTGF